MEKAHGRWRDQMEFHHPAAVDGGAVQAELPVLRLDVRAHLLVRHDIEERVIAAAKVGVAAVRAVKVRVALAASGAGAEAQGRLEKMEQSKQSMLV